MRFSVGSEATCVASVRASLTEARAEGADFVALPLVHPRLTRDARGISDAREEPLTRSDALLNSAEWSRLIVGAISSWREETAPLTREPNQKNKCCVFL